MINNNKPLVSILLPVHNRERFLVDCLKSLIKQSYRQIEIIAIDDKSSDNSLKVLKAFAKKYKKIRVYRNIKRYGIVMTLNRLLRRAKGDYIAFMSAKDVSSRSRIKKQLEFLLGNQGVVAIGSQCKFTNDKGKIIGKSDFPKENQFIYRSPLHGISMQFETVLINTTLIPKDLLRFQASSNYFIYSDLLMKLLPYGKFANLPRYYHYHRNDPKEYFGDLRIHLISLIKLWIKSMANYDYQLSIRSFFSPLTKQS
ncbi:MAG: glycosyltransferase family 2 protein [Candidatus Levybacteria bacterium]|nr:glycosyltransferase family 2 protein [Candidatus Levybacteria bacterium]